MPSVRVNLGSRPKDTVVEIPILGAFKNGTTTEVDASRWRRFQEARGEGNYPEDGNLVIDTVKQREEAESFAKQLGEAEKTAEKQGVDSLKKDELTTLAASRGVPNPDDKTKAQLQDELGEGDK